VFVGLVVDIRKGASFGAAVEVKGAWGVVVNVRGMKVRVLVVCHIS
jgi:hypothetical protein